MCADGLCFDPQRDFADDGDFAGHGAVDMIVVGTYCPNLAAGTSGDVRHSSTRVGLVDFQSCTLKSGCGKKLAKQAIGRATGYRWHRCLYHC